MSKINKYNFLIWDDDGSPPTTCDDSEYVMPVIAGDTLEFQINFDTPITDKTGYELGIWNPSAGLIIQNIATLTELEISTIEFNLYATFTAGVYPGPWFRLVIYDTGDSNSIVYWSNGLKYKTVSTNTVKVKYRNGFDILNYVYEGNTSLYNQFRIDAWIGDGVVRQDKEGYELTSGLFETSETIFKTSKEVETRLLDLPHHAAFGSAVHHEEFYIDDVRYYVESGETYSVANQGRGVQRSNGTIRMNLYDDTFVASNT